MAQRISRATKRGNGSGPSWANHSLIGTDRSGIRSHHGPNQNPQVRALQAGIHRYAVSVAADNLPVLELLRGSGGLDPNTAHASFGIVEAQITIPLRVPATSR